MNQSTIYLALAIIIIVGLALAAARGHTLPVGICLTLIIAGTLVVLAPMIFSFLLQLFGRDAGLGEGHGSLGGIMVFVGIVGSIFSRRSVALPPK